MWRLENKQAWWSTSPWQFHLDLQRPASGWSGVCIADQPAPNGLFCVELPGAGDPQAIVDSYVRQSDLVVTYDQTPDRTVRPQVVWRVLRDGDLRHGVEAILSMQTSLLDSRPTLSVSSELGGELLRVDVQAAGPCELGDWEAPAALLQRPEAPEDWSFVMVAHPSDFVAMTLEASGSRRCSRWTLFPEALEKGVIRRSRIRGIFVPRSRDIELARLCLTELAAAAPPLAT